MNSGIPIYQILSNNTDVTDIVGDRIYPLYMQVDSEVPFVTFQQVANTPSNTKTGPSTNDEVLVQVNSIADTPELCSVLAQKVRLALDYANGTYEGVTVQKTFFQNELNTWDENTRNNGVCMIQQDYKIFILR